MVWEKCIKRKRRRGGGGRLVYQYDVTAEHSVRFAMQMRSMRMPFPDALRAFDYVL